MDLSNSLCYRLYFTFLDFAILKTQTSTTIPQTRVRRIETVPDLTTTAENKAKQKNTKVINTRCHVWPGCCADVGVMHGLCLLECLPICPPLTLAVSLWQKQTHTHTHSDTAAFSHLQTLCRNEHFRVWRPLRSVG